MRNLVWFLVGIFAIAGCGTGGGGTGDAGEDVGVGGILGAVDSPNAEVSEDVPEYDTSAFYPFDYDFRYDGQAPLRERLLAADVIDRVRFRSVAPAGAYVYEGMRNEYGNKLSYYAALDFTFDVLEYLRGSGGDTIVARAYGYVDQLNKWGNPQDLEKAERVAGEKMLPFRDSRWDDREAIVLLRPPVKSGEPYFFGEMGFDPRRDGIRTLVFKLTVADDIYPVWLPDSEAPASQGGERATSATKEQHFFLDDPAATSSVAVSRSAGALSPKDALTARAISKSSLRSRIAEIDTLVASFQGDPRKIRDCLSRQASYKRWVRDTTAAGQELGWTEPRDIGSGLPAGTNVPWRGLLPDMGPIKETGSSTTTLTCSLSRRP